jgi:hypothetical protein
VPESAKREKLRKLMANDTVDLWALDEVHKQGITLLDVGPERDQRSHRVSSSDAQEVAYFAAVRSRDGQFLFQRETGRFNGESFWSLSVP